MPKRFFFSIHFYSIAVQSNFLRLICSRSSTVVNYFCANKWIIQSNRYNPLLNLIEFDWFSRSIFFFIFLPHFFLNFFFARFYFSFNFSPFLRLSRALSLNSPLFSSVQTIYFISRLEHFSSCFCSLRQSEQSFKRVFFSFVSSIFCAPLFTCSLPPFLIVWINCLYTIIFTALPYLLLLLVECVITSRKVKEYSLRKLFSSFRFLFVRFSAAATVFVVERSGDE